MGETAPAHSWWPWHAGPLERRNGLRPAVPHISGLVEIINVISLCGGPIIRSYNAASRRCVASTHEHELSCQRDRLGAFSDRCTSRFGRRRPYLVGGTLLSMGALLLLGYAKDVASIFGLSDEHRETLTIWLAVLSIYFIDFSVNAAMACSRAILVDTLPTSEQELGNAWAGRMATLGSIAGFFIGNIKLPALFPIFGKTQLQILSILSAILLFVTNGTTVYSVSERVLVEPPPKRSPTGENLTSFGMLRTVQDIWRNALTLPYVIMRICMIQFLSWIGWFPVLFYTTLWIRDIYTRGAVASGSLESPSEIAEEGTRAGNHALLWSSIVAMTAFIILPLIISRPEPRNHTDSSVGSLKGNVNRWWEIKMHVATLWAISNAVFACSMAATWFAGSLWMADIIIGATGFSWAVSLWAPFALLGEQIHSSSTGAGYSPAPDEEDIPLHDRRVAHDEVPNPVAGASFLENGNLSARASRTNLTDELDDVESGAADRDPLLGNEEATGVGDKAGIILGIHNVFVVIPQFIVTGISAIIFAIFEPSRAVSDSRDTPTRVNGTLASRFPTFASDIPVERTFDSIGFVFRLGGLSAGIACVLCWQLSKHLQKHNY